jgi:hypothetical protein
MKRWQPSLPPESLPVTSAFNDSRPTDEAVILMKNSTSKIFSGAADLDTRLKTVFTRQSLVKFWSTAAVCQTMPWAELQVIIYF